MKTEYFVIRDILLDGQARTDEEIAADPQLREQVRRDRFSITSLCADERSGKLYCGCTNTGGDILYEFDVAAGRFRGLNFPALAEPCDAKIHRGLWLDRKLNSLFFGLATLSGTDKVALCPGGRLMRFDIGSQSYHELGRPSPGSYIQAIEYDPGRKLIYSFTLPALGFVVTDLASGRVRRSVPLESIVHIPAIDPAGGVWGTWGRHDHAFFRYDPDADSFDFCNGLKMPTSRQASNIMYLGAGPCDCMLTGPDGMIYVGSALGELYRLDPAARTLEYLARPMPYNRLPALAFGPDGLLYGVGGDDWQVTLFAYDLKRRSVQIIGQLKAPDGRRCYRPHDIAYMEGRFFVGETDNPKSSGYLWAVRP